MAKQQGPKIATVDIETAPIDARVWGLWQQNVGLNQITTEWSLLSYAAKPLGSKRVQYSDNRGQADVRDDYRLMEELWHVLDTNDIIIAQNGVKFDMKKIRARMIMLGFRPFRPVKVIDTMLEAKRIASFTSNKLEWLSTYLSEVKKLKHKEFPGFDLWSACLEDNLRAWKEMQDYNKVDVIATEEVYLRLRPWIQGHPNVAQYYDDEKIRCPNCGSDDLNLMDEPVFTNVGEYDHYSCNCCGAWSRNRYTRNSKAKRKALLIN